VRGGVTPAYILPANPFLTRADAATDPIHWAPNLTIEFGRHTDGSQEWHELYGMPSIGVGLSIVSLHSAAAGGRPIEAYTFFSYPFARLSDRVALTTDFGMGLSWRWRQLNEQTEGYEEVLGSSVDARIDWGFYVRYASTPRLAVFTGVDFTHRSNGGTVQPNLGINVLGPRVAVEYSFSPETPSAHPPIQPPPFHPSWDVVVGGAGGVKSVVESRSPFVRGSFGAFTVTGALQRHFYRFGRIAAGTDLFYDGSTGARADASEQEWRADAGQRFSLGLYGGYEHIVGRFSAIAQAGATAVRGFDSVDSRLYSRFGWRYRITDGVWSTIAVRAHGFHNASALEIGAGFRIPAKLGSNP